MCQFLPQALHLIDQVKSRSYSDRTQFISVFADLDDGAGYVIHTLSLFASGKSPYGDTVADNAFLSQRG